MFFKVRQYEKDFINLLDYQAMVSSQIYTRYYFELRELFDELQRGSTGDDGHDNFPLKPLELWRAKKLQLVSSSFKMQKRVAGSPVSPEKGKKSIGGGGGLCESSPWVVNRDDESPQSDDLDIPTQTVDDNDVTYTPRGRYVQS